MIPGDEDEDPANFEGPNLEYGLPPISADPPLHTWTRRLLLPWFSHKRVDSYVPLTRDLCRGLLDGFADAGHADAAADYAQQIPVRVIARILGVSTDLPTPSPGGCATCWSSPTTPSGASAAPRASSITSWDSWRSDAPAPRRRPHERAAHHRGRREARRRRHRARHGGARPDRRGRHDLERHRLLAVAPGLASRRPQAPRGRAGAHADRGRGAPAGLLAGDHGSGGDPGRGVRRAAP